MDIICPKCGYKRSSDDNLAIDSGVCPNCGVIYAKANANAPSAAPPQSAPAKRPRTKRPDEKYCYDCAEIIPTRAAICPYCGAGSDAEKGGVNKTALLLITFFLGGIGGHKFYLKKNWMGVLYLVFCWTYIPGFIALIEFIVYASTSSADLRRKYRESSGSAVAVVLACSVGFTAIAGILAAVAIPQYLNYLSRAKTNAAKSNYEIAINFVKGEFAKRAEGRDAANNAVLVLNDASKKSPHDPMLDAYAAGTEVGKGQVALSVDDLNSVPIGDVVKIQVDWTGDAVPDHSMEVKFE